MVFSTFLIEGSEHNDDDTIPMHCAKRLCRDVDDRRAGIGIPMHVNVRTTTVKLVPVTIHTCNVPRAMCPAFSEISIVTWLPPVEGTWCSAYLVAAATIFNTLFSLPTCCSTAAYLLPRSCPCSKEFSHKYPIQC